MKKEIAMIFTSFALAIFLFSYVSAASGSSCHWSPSPSNSGSITTPSGDWLFINGYYEKRLLCEDGIWRSSIDTWDKSITYVVRGSNSSNDQYPNCNLQRPQTCENWGIRVMKQTETAFSPWKIINDTVSGSFGKRWIKTGGECHWPLGTQENPTSHDDILFYQGEDEARLLCFNSEWYKTKSVDFAGTSTQDIFFKAKDSIVGSWTNNGQIWVKGSDDGDDDGNDNNDNDRKPLLLPVNSNEFCETNWQCSGWSECSDGISTRQCVEANDCGTDYNQPLEVTSCDMPVKVNPAVQSNALTLSSWMLWLWILVALIIIIFIVIILNR